MNKYSISLIAFIAFVSIIVTGYLLISQNTKKTAVQVAIQNSQKINNKTDNLQVVPSKTITLTNSGFTPLTLTINKGERVIWLNNSGVVGTVNSDNYPTNLLYPFLNFGQFNDGSSFSTIFAKPGTYTYYNFLSQNQNQKGTIIVK